MDRRILADDRDEIETEGDSSGDAEFAAGFFRRGDEQASFPRGQRATGFGGGAAELDLDDDEDFAFAGQKIDLAGRGADVPGQNFQPGGDEARGGAVFGLATAARPIQRRVHGAHDGAQARSPQNRRSGNMDAGRALADAVRGENRRENRLIDATAARRPPRRDHFLSAGADAVKTCRIVERSTVILAVPSKSNTTSVLSLI